MKRLVIYIAILLCINNKSVLAQTFNFSQFHTVPLSLNPALTGDFNGSYRLSSNYRSQWVFGGTPYITGSLGAEFRLLTKKLNNEKQKLGIGINVISDKSNDGALSFTDVSFSSAYHLSLNSDGTESLAIGLQGTYHQRMINLLDLTFENQFTSNGFINTNPIGETFSSSNKSYVDANVGVFYKKTFDDQAGSFFIGVSVYNLKQPNVSITPNATYQLPTRYTGHLGGSIYLNKYLDLQYSGVYMQMAGAQNITLGTALNYYLDMDFNKKVLLGSYYRVGDALIPYVGLGSEDFQIGISYDATISSLKTISQTKNAFELSLIYSPDNLISRTNVKKKYSSWF